MADRHLPTDGIIVRSRPNRPLRKRELDRFVNWLREEDLGREPMFADLDERTFRRYARFLVDPVGPIDTTDCHDEYAMEYR